MKNEDFAGLLAGVMLAVTALTPMTALAAEPENGKITYNAGEGYTFEKISHPTKGTMSADGIVDYIGDGKVEVITDTNDSNLYNAGDRGQSYSWSAIAYGDWLYVGTCYAAMGNTLTLMDGVLGDKFDKDVMEAALKAMFNNTFFYGQTKPDGTPDTDSEGILVKVNTKTGEMKLLLSKSMNGVAPLFRNAVAYKDKLYFCGSVYANGRSGLPSVYEIDPTDDSYKAVYVGLDSLQDYGAAYKAGVSTGIRGMCVYNDELVISNVYMNAATGESGALILASSNPSEGKSSFRTIATQADMFNYPAYRYTDSIYGGSVWDMAEYNGHLYVSICTGTPDNAPDDNSMQSFAIIRGDRNEDGTYSWTQLVGDQSQGARYGFGIDLARTRSGAANLTVYKDKLYIGEYNDEEIALERILFDKSSNGSESSLGGIDCSFVNANLEQSVNLYAMDENEDMELVVGDKTYMFPNGGTSGLGSGFGHNENQYIWRMQVYDGKLYVGTFDTSSLLEPIGQFSNGDIIGMTPEQWRQQMQLIKELLQLLMDKYGTSPIATIDENEEGEEVTSEIVDDATSNDEDEAFESDIAGLVDMMDMTPEVLEGDSTVTALCDEESVDNRENSLRDFADYYSNMLEGYNEISANYELPDDLKDAFETLLSQDKLDKINSVIECLIYMRDAERGFDMYVTEDGTNFTKLTTSGFGDPYNHGLRVFAITNQGLCLGTANPFYGTQLWIQRAEESETPSTPTPSTPAPSTPTPSENPDITPAPGTEPSVTPAPTFTPAPTAVPTKAPVVTPAPAAAATAAKGIPQTSDSFPLPIVVLLLIGSAVAMGVMTFSYCRKKK